MRCLLTLPRRKEKSLKDDVAIVESLDTKQRIVPTRKVVTKRALKTHLKKGDTPNLKRTVKERARPICQSLDGTIVVNWVILLRTARNHAKILILLEKMGETGNSLN